MPPERGAPQAVSPVTLARYSSVPSTRAIAIAVARPSGAAYLARPPSGARQPRGTCTPGGPHDQPSKVH
eukprot:14331089-Alexandrium_andersonii.AAC.1